MNFQLFLIKIYLNLIIPHFYFQKILIKDFSFKFLMISLLYR